MALVKLERVTKTYAAGPVLTGVDWTVEAGKKIGLIGANGSGKTTLLRLILGTESADTGGVVTAKGLRCGYQPQRPELNAGATILDVVSEAFADLHRLEDRMHALSEAMAGEPDPQRLRDTMAEYDRVRARFESAGGYAFETRRNGVLTGLGFRPEEFGRRVGELSGGQQCRVALARLLVRETDLLLLDEPTNHLDLEASHWLEGFLHDYAGTVILVSHDRYLLDRVVDHIAELESGRLTVYAGGYTDYAEQKRVRLLTAIREYEKQQAFLRKERQYVADFLGTQRSRQARGRQKRLARRAKSGEFVDRPGRKRRDPGLSFKPADRGGDRVLRLERIGKGYDGRTLFQDVTMEMSGGDKVGILGPNGCGKSTLLKIALGLVEPNEGRVRLYESQSVGYYDQQHAGINKKNEVLEEVRSARPEMSIEQVRTFLGSFLFHDDDVFKRVGQLSGGEQSRVLLAKLVLAEPNLLVLDEPTNHLDIAAREVLEEALRSFPGSILLISHDRYFLDRVVNRLMVFEPEGVRLGPGTYSEYLWRRQQAVTAQRQAEQAAAAEKRKRRKKRAKTGRPAEAQPADDPLAGLDRDQLEAVYLERLEALDRIERHFADPEMLRDEERSRQLKEDHDSLRAEISAVEAALEERD